MIDQINIPLPPQLQKGPVDITCFAFAFGNLPTDVTVTITVQ